MKGPYAVHYGAPYLMAHRADLHRLLCGLVPAETVRLGTQCTGVSSAGGGAVAHFADGSQVEADVVVGADGMDSTVRESLFSVQPVRCSQQWHGAASCRSKAYRPRWGSAATNMSNGSARPAM